MYSRNFLPNRSISRRILNRSMPTSYRQRSKKKCSLISNVFVHSTIYVYYFLFHRNYITDLEMSNLVKQIAHILPKNKDHSNQSLLHVVIFYVLFSIGFG